MQNAKYIFLRTKFHYVPNKKREMINKNQKTSRRTK